jgi:regulator of protease activity HflC (stomatin/prohibitin superfamily)
MPASVHNSDVPRWIKISYVFVAALIALIAYRVGSIWFGNAIFILLAFGATWFVKPESRRFVRAILTVVATTLLLSTAFTELLNAPEQVSAIENSAVLNFLLGSAAAKVLVSFVFAFLTSLLLLGISFLIAVYMSADWILSMGEVYGVTRGQAMRLLLSMFLHTNYPYYIVEDGEIKQSKPQGLLPLLGGPGKVIIKPYNAVVFERGGEVTRIEGPGLITTGRFELPKEVVDLRKQSVSWTTEQLLTKDHVPLVFHCGVSFRIEQAKETGRQSRDNIPPEQDKRDVISGDYKVYKDTLRRAVYETTKAGWQATTKGATESQLLQLVREYPLEAFYKLQQGHLIQEESIIDKIVQETLARVKKISPIWGVTVSSFRIKSFEAPEDIQEKLLEMWAARYAERSKLIKAETEKESIITISEGRRQARVVEARGEGEALTIKAKAARDSAITEAEGARKSMIARGKGQADALARVERVKASAVEALVNQLLQGMREAKKVDIDHQIVERFARVVEQLSSNLVYDDLTAFRYVEALEKIAATDATKTITLGSMVRESPIPALPKRSSERSE